jgi:hypothetical protein
MMDPDDDDVRQDQKVSTQPRWVSVLSLVWIGAYVALAYPARPSFMTPTVIGVIVGSYVVLLLARHLWRRRRRPISPMSSASKPDVELHFMSLMVGMLTSSRPVQEPAGATPS